MTPASDKDGRSRAVWLFSLDSARYPNAVPMTTGGLAAYFASNGQTAAATDLRLVHMKTRREARRCLEGEWRGIQVSSAEDNLGRGVRPVFAFSCYTWNIDLFSSLMEELKTALPEALVIAGGPQVQNAEDYVGESLDAVVLGEGEVTFQCLLDRTFSCETNPLQALAETDGVAYRDGRGRFVRTKERKRIGDLSLLPSALTIVPLTDESGVALYDRASYETTRGCPFKCAFCEWGTGATGVKMHRHSIDRVRTDLELLVEGGVGDIFFCDSNFGAVPEDLEKAQVLVALREKTGRPRMFCTSWSKNPNRRVRDIATLLHRHGLLEHFTLALQTLTPAALEACNRKNLRVNRYQEIVADLVARGVPVGTELIWGLPGDTLENFERNFDLLVAVFPTMSIYGYTLLPGTEFHERATELEIETETLAEYGNWMLDYVVASSSFSKEEGLAGYELVAAYMSLGRGNIIPLTIRFLALSGVVSCATALRKVLRAAAATQADRLPEADKDGLALYSVRDRLYSLFLQDRELTFDAVEDALLAVLAERARPKAAAARALRRVLALDRALCPTEPTREAHSTPHFDYRADLALRSLTSLNLPPSGVLSAAVPTTLKIKHPASADDLLAPGTVGSDAVRANHAVFP